MEIFPAQSTENAIRVEFFGDEVDRIREINTVTGEVKADLKTRGDLPGVPLYRPAGKDESGASRD